MKRIVFLLCSGLLIISTAVFSQPPIGDEIPPPPPPPEEEEMMAERFQTIQIWKLTEELDLSQEQAAKFFPLFNEFQDKVKKIRDENGELMDKLRGYVLANEDGSKVNGVIAKIEANEVRILTTMTDFRKDAAKILTDMQMAKLVLFQHEFPRQMRKAMRHAAPSAPNPLQRGPGKVNPPLGMNRGERGSRFGNMQGPGNCQP